MIQKTSALQYIVSICVLMVVVLFGWRMYQGFGPSRGDVVSFYANFESIGERLQKGATVKISGVEVGYIKGIHLNLDDNSADVEFCIQSDISLYEDTRAFIMQPFIGQASLWLQPGNASQGALSPGSRILNTDPPKDMMELLESQVFQKLSKGDEADEEIKNADGVIENAEISDKKI